MADKDSKRREAIDALLTERRKYEAWLSQLETRRGATAEHVFVRVHEDYTTRLSDVRRRLTAEADSIRALVSDLEERLADEQRAMTDKSDERAELELRAAVGEFSPEEWNDTRKSLDAAIEKIRKRFDTTERDLTEMRELFESVTSPTPVAGPIVAGEEPSSLAESVDALEPPATADAERVDAGPADDGVLDVGEEPAVVPPPAATAAATAAPEPDVVREPEPERAPAPEPPPVAAVAKDEPKSAPKAGPKPGPKPGPRGSTPFDELAFLKSIAGSPTAPEAMPAVPPPSAAGAGRESAKTEMPDFPAAPLGAPTPRTSQAIRSLKCQECGTLNFPTEWYCEKCGGELAAF